MLRSSRQDADTWLECKKGLCMPTVRTNRGPYWPSGYDAWLPSVKSSIQPPNLIHAPSDY